MLSASAACGRGHARVQQVGHNLVAERAGRENRERLRHDDCPEGEGSRRLPDTPATLAVAACAPRTAARTRGPTVRRARRGDAVREQADVLWAASKYQQQRQSEHQREHAEGAIPDTPGVARPGHEGEELDVAGARDGASHADEADREVSLPLEEVDGERSRNHRYEDGVAQAARNDVPDGKLNHTAGARCREQAHAGEERRGRHHPARAVAVGETADERRHAAAYPGAGGYGVGDGAAVPAHVLEYEVLYAAEHHLCDTRGPNGGKGGGAQHQPTVVEGRAGPPVVELEYKGHGPPGSRRPAKRWRRRVAGPRPPPGRGAPGRTQAPGPDRAHDDNTFGVRWGHP